MTSAQPQARTVFLVGAGPGDPRLITIAGAEALQEADVVVHDRLVSPALLKLARDAELIDVGKMPGGPSTPQDQINRLMIDLARQGRRVVRLKGGDPFVFGRGGEEASALAAAGIPMQLVPGVSSAHAAAAAFGIAVTDRRAASAVTVVTGSEGDGEAPPIDWQAVAQVGGTLVLMMGWRNFDQIVERLVAAGLSADTPAAAIEQAWTSSQRAIFAPLGKLRARASDMQPPVTVAIGAVTSLATPEVSWSVMGRRVLVTRAAAQAKTLVERLRALNAEVIVLPTIEIRPADPVPVDEAVRRLARGDYDFVALTSVNGVIQLWDAMRRHGLDSRALASARVAAIGSETARALEERGIEADIVPAAFTSAALAAELTQEDLRGKRVLLARASTASRLLRDQLRAAGAEIDDVALYDIVTPSADEDALAELNRGVDVVTLTSPSTARGLVELAGDSVDLDSLHTVCIGPVTAEEASRLGFRVVATADRYTIDGLAQAVARYIAGLGPLAEKERESA
ncbi:MAG: uroporphyrinogen-III C-methyltransferase [Chloroflexota bacterium]|nr:uroporphyrinogen-III C-methyltransferase [Chloroflexota bacterium]